MNFDMNEEQRMLTDSLSRYLRDQYGFEHRREASRRQGGFSGSVWSSLAEMGVLGLTTDPEYGGFGEGPAGSLLVQQELGRAMVTEPVVAGAVAASAVLERYGSESAKRQWLPLMATGERIVTLAWLESGQRCAHERVQTMARSTAEGYLLTGQKTLVSHAGVSHAMLLVARIDGSEETALFLVPTNARGVSLRSYSTLDGASAADIDCANVPLPLEALIGQVGGGMAALQHGIDHAIAALCAQGGGVMERVIELTGEYLRTRKQFGMPLGTFQALQHRMADMLVQKELAVSMAYVAAQALGEANPEERSRKLSAAKYMTGKAARYVGQQAIQLHGGMGMTDELAVGDYFKWLTMLEPLLGDSDWHLNRYGELLAA